MQISLGVLAALIGVSTLVAAAPTDQSAGDLLLDLNRKATIALENDETQSSKRSTNKKCTIAYAAVRRDWETLSKKEKKAYIKAVLCLRKKPSKADPSFAPGSRNRYDDFVAVHINQTRSIHGTGNFFTWHRYYTWAYEKALQDECGYKGTQPYWNWFNTGEFATNSVFDGSDTSMSGDGKYFKHNGSFSGRGSIHIPSGKGGGCIETGPFAGAVANLGPPSPGDASHSIKLMQDEFQGRFPDGFLGLHAAGHYTMGGDSADLYSSPNDPNFFLHHSMVDRIYWIWQALHPKQAKDIAGTITISNLPPSRDAVKSDPLNMGVNARQITIGHALDTLGGSPFCYVYL